MRYETRRQQPVRGWRFAYRLARHAAIALVFACLSLLGGMAGYRHFEHLGWLDSFVNAAMLLGGMGPVDDPQTVGGKFFAGAYALYAGLVFLVTAGLVLTPVVHRVIHEFHWED
jgi:hypothetical protein